MEDAERRAEKQEAEVAVAEGRALEAERQKVALSSRVASLEGLKAQLEQQLRLEREVSAQELARRQRCWCTSRRGSDRAARGCPCSQAPRAL